VLQPAPAPLSLLRVDRADLIAPSATLLTIVDTVLDAHPEMLALVAQRVRQRVQEAAAQGQETDP
jgi:hypothetical protein